MNLKDTLRIQRSISRRAASLTRASNGYIGDFYHLEMRLSDNVRNDMQKAANILHDMDTRIEKALENVEVDI